MRIEDLLEDTDLFEMSNFRKNETGLPMNIYVSSGSGLSYKLPRIKAMIDLSDKMNIGNTISIVLKRNITDNDIVGYHKLSSSNLSALRDFINLNYDALIQYWNDEISTTELTQKIQRLP
jgi:hypothetical protein